MIGLLRAVFRALEAVLSGQQSAADQAASDKADLLIQTGVLSAQITVLADAVEHIRLLLEEDDIPAAVLGSLLAGGEASRLYQGLVKGKELLLGIEGGLNWPLDDAFSYEGPNALAPPTAWMGSELAQAPNPEESGHRSANK